MLKRQLLASLTGTILLSVCLVGSAFAGPTGIAPGTTNGTVAVPYDHDQPELGGFDLYFEFGAPFDPALPTVIYCQDGQQFRIQEGRMAGVQERFFGPGINLLGVPGRTYTDAVAAAVSDADGTVDWRLAYQYYRYSQWCGDLDAVRRAVLGDTNQIMLYGRSGGGMLVQEYLSLYGQNASRTYVQAAANPKLDQELEHPSDPFWREIGEHDAGLQGMLLEGLAKMADQRSEIIEALSRQHFFHKESELAAERSAFIKALQAGDQEYLAEKLDAYQVNIMKRMLAGPIGLAVRVRQYEFFQPVYHRYDLFGDRISPTPEMQYRTAKPLLDLYEAGEIPAWDIDLDALGDYEGNIFILAGAADAAIPPAYQRRLAGLFDHSTLLMVQDDHMMKNLQDAELYKPLHMNFFIHGPDSPQMKAILEATKPLQAE